MEKLFVYGSLMPNQEHHSIIKRINGTWQKAFIYGEIKKILIQKKEYQSVILKNTDQRILGYLFSSYALSYLWKIIDDFEGQNYLRKKTKVFLNNFRFTEAYIYSYFKKNY